MSFNDRQKAFEDKYHHDQELQFKVEIRRDKLFGLWVAEQLGLTGDEAEAYAKSVVVADLEEAGSDDVIRKVVADIQEKKLDISKHRLEKKLEEMFVAARDQIMSE
tara:strand:+ start:7293 stop:7610 length:318 start_codon:yes stop_codon:yes gene_type:complete